MLPYSCEPYGACEDYCGLMEAMLVFPRLRSDGTLAGLGSTQTETS